MTTNEAAEALVGAATKGLEKAFEPALAPVGLLYHFTDASGVVGIVTHRTLRATRASCMNDESELIHGMELARSLIGERLQNEPNSVLCNVWKNALDSIAGASAPPSRERIKFDAFVASFCEHVDKSVHWLSYGRGGFGYALGFDSAALDLDGWTLTKVVYDVEQQRRVLSAVLGEIEQTALSLLATLKTRPANEVQKIESTAGHVLMNASAMLAPNFKHPAFRAEDEWRLFRVRIESEKIGVQPAMQLKFRVWRNIVAPFVELNFPNLALKKIVMGIQIPEHPARESLRLLLQSQELPPDAVQICLSDIPVRGAA